MRDSRDAANISVRGSDRCSQARDPATAGAGGPDLRDARRSILIACGLQDRTRSPCVGGVIPTVLDVSSLNCAGPFTGAGGFFHNKVNL